MLWNQLSLWEANKTFKVQHAVVLHYGHYSEGQCLGMLVKCHAQTS